MNLFWDLLGAGLASFFILLGASIFRSSKPSRFKNAPLNEINQSLFDEMEDDGKTTPKS